MKVVENESPIYYGYVTIKLTQSRINKGLLAIPVSLVDKFPKKKMKIQVFFDDLKNPVEKNFTPYESNSRECRIGGMREFYGRNRTKEGDEIVIQFAGDNKYRISMEGRFRSLINKYQLKLDISKSDGEVDNNICLISSLTNVDKKEVLGREFLRLSQIKMELRNRRKEQRTLRKENVPAPIRNILTEIYKGKCQLTDFSFTMRTGKPYFEIHHIKPELGHHLKNLLVVCPNVHAQFDFAHVEEYFDNEGWLRKVRFNKEEHAVKQFIDNLPKKFLKEVHVLEEKS